MARQKGLSFYRRKKKINFVIIKEIFSWAFGIFTAIFIAIVFNFFLGMTTEVVGMSMEPDLVNGQKILIDRFVYVLSTPSKGDVIVFWPNGNQNTHYYVKRVVAGPGDEVLIEDGKLYVNEQEMKEFDEKILDPGIAENVLTMGKGEYFCVGDNINNSEDSRSANIGFVKSEDIVGKAWFKLSGEHAKMGFVK